MKARRVGVKLINGIEYRLYGRYQLFSQAMDQANKLHDQWESVKVRSSHGVVSIWLRGKKTKLGATS